jgi:hypothetical protein
MRWVLALGAALAGCQFDTSGLSPAIGVDAPDGSPDGAGDLPDAPVVPCTPFLASNVTPCSAGLPDAAALTLAAGEHTYDTTTGILSGPAGSTAPPSAVVVQIAGGEARVLVTRDLTIPNDAALLVVGARPLIVLDDGAVTIDGQIDASARSAPARRPGAGGSSPGCGAGAGRPGTGATALTGGGGGGGGGGYGADGDDGGDGGGAGAGARGIMGVANGGTELLPLRGGCAGGAGGSGAAGSGGTGGDGGGAVQISARGSLTIGGAVRVGGAGATGGSPGRGGAGGGGSGGAVLLEAEAVTIAAPATLCANGGGGGEGADTTRAGAAGQDASCSERTRAPGGRGLTGGGDGGEGGNLASEDGGGGASGRAGTGGGGAGGSVGRIRIVGRASRNVDAAATVSPEAF